MRTRMAPSPTGEFHIGSMRTLLYSYALGKQNGGQFILRIEDTDKKREVAGALERLQKVVHDYGLDWDEYYKQSERLEIYQKHAKELVENDKAYYCFCSEDRLNTMREEQKARGLPTTKYDGLCRSISLSDAKARVENGESYVVRLKVPVNEDVHFDDAILGHIVFNSKDVEDLVLLKSDGYPTYHLAVVIDDHLMNISHVLRGQEWLPSAPKHVLLYKAFGWDIPVHAHLPNLKDKGATKKLSKRFGDVHAVAFLEKGYLPEALLNFLMFLGWNPGGEKEVYTLEEFVKDFSLARVHKTDLVVFDREKLAWFNGQYIRSLDTKALLAKLTLWAENFDVTLVSSGADEAYVLRVLSLVQERMKLLSEYNSLVDYFYMRPMVDSSLFLKYTSDIDRAKVILKGFHNILISLDTWTIVELQEKLYAFIKENNYSAKEAFMTLRIALTGKDATPHIFDMLELFGKEESLSRISANF